MEEVYTCQDLSYFHIANKVKLDAIKTQIHHRKKVLGQKFPTSCGFFSQNNVAFSLDEMIAKLKFIISLG